MHGIEMEGETLEKVRRGRRGPIEGEHLIGHDSDTGARPGVPMHARRSPATGAPESEPVDQPGHEPRIQRAPLERPTPVFGTAQPLRGLSGVMRKAAYVIPEHRARHWMLLMAADRIDVAEARLGEVLAEPLEKVLGDPVARRVRSNPAPYLVGAVVGLLAARKLLD